MTIEEKIHVFENSRLVANCFTPEAVTAAYVEARKIDRLARRLRDEEAKT